MKKSLFTTLVGLIVCHFSFAQQDVILLKDSSVVKGQIISLDLEKSVEINTTCCDTLTIAMEKVEKIQFDNASYSNADQVEVSPKVDEDFTVKSEKERKRERRKDIFISLIDNTAEVLTANPENASQTDDSTETSNNPPGTETATAGSNATDTNVGNGCFVNPNFYARRIRLVHTLSNKRHDISLQPESEGCLYDLPEGVYHYEVFTTFSNRMITKAQVQITSGKTNKITLSEDNLN